MYDQELTDTMNLLTQEGKGLLAADESIPTIAKRFATIGVENTAENRLKYRHLLATTPELGNYVQGVILFEETFDQKDQHGTPIAELFMAQNIVPGIKIDQGLTTLANTNNEQVTMGLDHLAERLTEFKAKGAKFAKWRNVYTISDTSPSITAMRSGAEVLARYAATCQSLGIVPIVEPEILMDGDHDIVECAETTQMVLHEVFNALFMHQVYLPHMILKPNMVTSGKNFKPFSSTEEIVDYTLSVFRATVPAAVPTINFLSGGQSPQQATEHLNALNATDPQPWLLSFSYGRALQEECLNAWRGQDQNIEAAQKILLERAKLNSMACLGSLD